MVAKGRNDLQMHIDEYAIVLERLLFEVPKQINSSFSELKKEIEGTAVGLPLEEAYTIKSSLTEAYRMDNEAEMIESFYKSMVIMICSYCETTLLSMLPIDIQEDYKYKSKKIDIYYKVIQVHYDLKPRAICKLWKEKTVFVNLRNNIVHGKKYNSSLLTHEYLNTNLQLVKNMLRTIADTISNTLYN